MAQAIPQGYHSLTPTIIFKDTKKAIAFYQKAFGAKVLNSMPTLDGKATMHAAVQIGDSIIMMGDEVCGPQAKSAETLGGSPISLYLYVPNVDEAFKQAVAAGGEVTMPVDEAFWGDRIGSIRDPFGYSWMIGTHTRDLTDEQIRKNAEEFFAKMAKK